MTESTSVKHSGRAAGQRRIAFPGAVRKTHQRPAKPQYAVTGALLLHRSGLAEGRARGYKPAIVAMRTAIAKITRRRAPPDPADKRPTLKALQPKPASDRCLGFTVLRRGRE